MIQARVLLFVVLLALVPTTWAARVLIIHGSTTGHAQSVQNALPSSDTVELRTSVPDAETLATFDQAWDLRGLVPFVGLSDGEIASYVSYLALGRTLVALGEHNQGCSTPEPCFKPRNDSLLKLIDLAGGGQLVYGAAGLTQIVQSPFTGPNPILNNDVRFGSAAGVAAPGSGQFITIDRATGAGSALAFGRGSLRNATSGTLIVVFDVNWLDSPSFDPPDDANLLRNIVAYVNGRFAVEVVASGLRFPQAVAVHNGFLYIADRSAHTVWKKDLATNVISPVAGTGKVQTTSGGQTVLVAGRQGYNGDGIMATQAQLNGPAGVAVDANGNVFVADSGNHVVRKINTGGMITTVAGTPKTPPKVTAAGQLVLSEIGNGGVTFYYFNGPRGISVDAAGNIFVADTMNQVIRKVLTNGNISELAGVAGLTGSSDGCVPGQPDCIRARLNDPRGVAVDSLGNVYIADGGNNKIRKVTGTSVTSVAAGALRAPAGVAVGADGALYISDTVNNRVQRVGVSGGVTTLASELNVPVGLVVDTNGDVYVADQVNNRIVKIVSE